MENMEPGHSTFIAEIGNYISLKKFYNINIIQFTIFTS